MEYKYTASENPPSFFRRPRRYQGKAFRQKKHRYLEKNPNEHDLGLYDILMNIWRLHLTEYHM